LACTNGFEAGYSLRREDSGRVVKELMEATITYFGLAPMRRVKMLNFQRNSVETRQEV
jgi:hypothetical protein